MKILFLDVDGVLNSHQSIRMFYRMGGGKSGRQMEFCPISCSNLLEILARIPDLKIVVSSTWRIGRDLEGLRNDLKDTGLPLDRIIGMTPVVRMTRVRGQEIASWLEDHPEVAEFVIVDDDSDMGSLMDKLVQTDTRMGLMWDKAGEIMKRFGVTADVDAGFF